MSMISEGFLGSTAPTLLGGKSLLSLSSMSDARREDLSFLLPLSGDYPGIEGWFIQKVVVGEFIGTRHIFRIERDGRLVALGIAKNEAGERKICTVRVHPSYVGRGLGVRVFDQLLYWLQTDKPVLTVSEHNLPKFQRLFDHYGFMQTSRAPNLYKEGVTELAYNEVQTHWQ